MRVYPSVPECVVSISAYQSVTESVVSVRECVMPERETGCRE